MKRILGGLIALIALATLLAGCGESASKQRIGISIPSADHGWTGGVVWWAQQAKAAIEKEHPELEVIVSTARDAAEQVDKIENLMSMGIKALVVLPHEPGPLTGICEQAKQGGAYLVVVDRGLTKPVADMTVVGDNPGFGRAAAEAMAAKLGGKGDIVIMEGIPCQVNTDRVNGFRETLAKYPGIRVLESQAANWDTEKGLKLMENFLQKYPKIDGLWTGDDDVLLGALKAYEESGRKDIRCCIGGAGAKTIVKRVLEGDPLVSFDVTYPPRMIEIGARHAADILTGAPRPAEKRLVIEAEIISAANAKDFYFPDSIF